MKKYAEITKVDAELRMVYGYASTEALDSQGEVIKLGAITGALEDYMKFANIREMHTSSAVGVAKEASIDEKGLYIAAKVVDDDAWEKVTEGVYKGFSIGGRVTERDKLDKTVITGMKLTEISLVDRPANPDAVFDVFKVDGENDDQVADETKPDTAAKTDETLIEEPAVLEFKKGVVVEEETIQPDIDALAEILDKGDITPARLVELANADIAQKGMYAVSSFAQILQDISYLQESTEWEAAYEEDGSTIPAQIKAWLTQGVTLFTAHAAEEAGELIADDDKTITATQLAETTGDVSKAGSRNSKSDQAKIQDMHDTAVALGAECDEANSGKHEHGGDLEKMNKLTDDLAKAHDRIKELEAMPTIGKALLNSIAISKAEENASDLLSNQPETITEVKKADGTIDKEATATLLIKNAHKSPMTFKL